MMTTINDAIPYELLCKIFLYCLPSNPLMRKQPELANAPMLLCHVCSYWRAVAVSYPNIWTHLYYVSSITEHIGFFRTDDLSFLLWWFGNVGSLSPSLRLKIKEDTTRIERRLEQMDTETKSFMLKIMTSARYLNLDSNYSILLQHLLGGRTPILPSMDTLVIRADRRNCIHCFIYTDTRDSSYVLDTEEVVSTVQRKRQLYFEDMPLLCIKPVMVCSNITNMHAHFFADPNCWYFLLRACTSLETGSFYIVITGSVFTNLPTSNALPRLRQLSLRFLRNHATADVPLLHGIHLPSLTSLRLTASPNIDINRLHETLSSTPALKELQLGAIYIETLADCVLFPGDRDLIGTSLQSVVPVLESIHFAGHRRYLRPDFQDDRNRIVAVLTGPWLELGRTGTRINYVELDVKGWSNSQEEIEVILRDLKPSLGEHVEMVVRARDAPNLWELWGKDSIDDFDDLKFRKSL